MSTSRTYGRRGTKRKLNLELSEPQKKPRTDSRLDSSPPKLARDLSQNFEHALSASAPSSPSKLAKRMLGRSKTESSLDSPQGSSKSLLDRTSSLPSVMSRLPSPPRPAPFSPVSAAVSDPSSSPQRPALANNRTYAGKTRSFLVTLSTDQSLPPELQDDLNSRESYAVLRSRWGVDNSEDDPYPEVHSPVKSDVSTPNGTPSKRKAKGRLKEEASAADLIHPLKSITEIRNKGQNRRFLDEVGYLLEGMNKNETPALKKASGLEIVTRLCESDFARQAKAADFLQSTWDAFIAAGAGKGDDKVLDTLLVAFIALVSRDLPSLTDIAHRGQLSSSSSSESLVVSILFSLLAPLSPETDPLLIITQRSIPDGQLKKLGIAKTDRAVLRTLHSTMLSKTRILRSKTSLSNALLLCHSLAALPLNLLSCNSISFLLRSLRTQLRCATELVSNLENERIASARRGDVKPNDNATPAYSGLLVDSQAIPFGLIHDLLVLLDGYLLGQWAPSRHSELDNNNRLLDDARDEWLAEGLVAVGIAAELANVENLPRTGKRKNGPSPSDRCTDIVFRVLVSLTHSDPSWGQALMQNDRAMMFIVRSIVRADDWRCGILARTQESVSMLPEEKRLLGRKKKKKREASPRDETDSEVESDYVSSGEEERGEHPVPAKSEGGLSVSATQALDWLCLALGLLTNLVQVVDESKTILRETTFDPDCIRQKLPCIRTCSCVRPVSILDILVLTYGHQLPSLSGHHHHHRNTVKSEPADPSLHPPPGVVDPHEAEADASFLLGHLSVLFGLLMINSPDNQQIILHALPLLGNPNAEDRKPSYLSASERKKLKIAQLVDSASELGIFYAVVSRRGRVMDTTDTRSSDPLREQDRDGAGGRVESDAARGANVAKGVISFLRELGI
ncbi:hypothetical protein D9757_006705 [Collybiopsis confluens]|uniref:Wings apart-like protein C-terminal domain-containing protein n=1 Tax=Collybiopsis confluens TaxID=2823264 RepID=A0A8H5HMZ6_9AGAR|nr:hypothetical protein D9757_006705 [Collybiopsis confluens]